MHRLFTYDDWANREELAHARALPLLAHIIGAQWLWLARLRGEEPRMAVWPELSRDDCARELDALREAWQRVLASPALADTIAYTNSKGEPWTSRIDDVLMHVILHGAYHRGQIASAVRATGGTPAYTDYIHYTRACM